MKLLELCLLFLVVSQINGYADRKCGPQLDQVSTSKRAVNTNQILPAVDNFPYPSNILTNIFQLEQESLVGKPRYARMLGIVDECCKRPCSLNELSAYCLP